ncbi:helix-turn-helix domain-containing protein [Streptomyces sp. NPDC048604]|uniref:helix-turn-helix domain-containing protein n=1 Tax=Streptomyces sp. NPDC048604 TaxID=3365578 RepID=UPI0037140822
MDPRIREFTALLGRLVDRSGLSLDTVADRTGHDRAAWERYVDGRAHPPRAAVLALAEAAGADTGRLLTLWQRAGEAPYGEPTAAPNRPGPSRARTASPAARHHLLVLLAGVVGALLVVTAVVLLADLGGG